MATMRTNTSNGNHTASSVAAPPRRRPPRLEDQLGQTISRLLDSLCRSRRDRSTPGCPRNNMDGDHTATRISMIQIHLPEHLDEAEGRRPQDHDENGWQDEQERGEEYLGRRHRGLFLGALIPLEPERLRVDPE